MWLAASSAKSSRTGARSTGAVPAAPLVPSERSASNANAIEPSSKPGNVDGVVPGSTESRFGGGGGGSQLGFDDDIGAGVTEPRAFGCAARALGGGEDSGRALASAAAPVPLAGGAFEDDGGAFEDDGGAADAAAGADACMAATVGAFGADGAELANAIVARCAPLLARAGNGGGLAAAAGFPAAILGSDGGRARACAASAAAMASGLAAAMRVESMRTAAISVESFESE